MSCRRKTTVLRIPASAFGFEYRREWDEFLRKHENDFEWEPGYFNESLSENYPLIFRWREADFTDPDWLLSRRDPAHPEIVPGPFLDYHLDEIIPFDPGEDDHGKDDIVLPLKDREKAEYLHLFQGLFPDLTLKDMDAVRYCSYEWYDGSNAPYFYSDLDGDPSPMEEIKSELEKRTAAERQILLENIDRLHTTAMGAERIKRNLHLGSDNVVELCRDLITDADCRIYRQGKNWYCENGRIRITVNAFSYTIITAHIMK